MNTVRARGRRVATARSFVLGAAVVLLLAGCASGSAPGATGAAALPSRTPSADPGVSAAEAASTPSAVATAHASPSPTPSASIVALAPATPVSTHPPLTPGPLELAVTACMAERGFGYCWDAGRASADAELAAVVRSAEAGHPLRSAETEAAESAAVAAALGIDPASVAAYDVALRGSVMDDAEACTANTGFIDPSSADGRNFAAITEQCVAERGPDSRWGATGAGSDYRWEEAGCAGYATHVTGNDRNN